MNRLPPGVPRAARRRFDSDWRAYARGRELKLEGRAHTQFAFYMDLAGVFLHDAVGDSEPKPCAFVLSSLRLGLSGKERIVDAVKVLSLDTCAGVLDAHQHPPCAVEGCNLQRCVWCSKHRVLCVQHKIQNHLLQLALVSVDTEEV